MNRRKRHWTELPLQRRGVSLIELVVVAAISSMMLVMITRWIHQTMTQSARFRDERRHQLSASRLTEHFRRSAWTADSVIIDQGGNSVSLSHPSGRCSMYEVRPDGVHFTQEETSGKAEKIDHFALSPASIVRWTASDDSRLLMRIARRVRLTSDQAAVTADRDMRLDRATSVRTARWLPLGKSPGKTKGASQ